MNTPICDFVEKYRRSRSVRLHMPGHKGKEVLGPEELDITEVPGADVLYAAQGILAESQANAASLFGSAKTLYSCEGSSLAIRAMLFLALLSRKNGERPLILAARNVHKTFVSAAALLDFDVQWLWGGEGLLSCRVSPEELEATLCHMEQKPLALYVTSPDYLGNLADIAGLSRICHAHGILLLVDNAHGAYLRFLPQSLHPMQLGADLCCDSAHKTLPVLTGGAYLHLSHRVPPGACGKRRAGHGPLRLHQPFLADPPIAGPGQPHSGRGSPGTVGALLPDNGAAATAPAAAGLALGRE